AEMMQARLNRQAALRADIGAALTDESDTLPQILQKCSESLVQHLDAAFSRIWLLNETGDTLELQASAGAPAKLNGQQARVPVGQFKAGLIAQQKVPYLTNDLAGDPEVVEEDWAQVE